MKINYDLFDPLEDAWLNLELDDIKKAIRQHPLKDFNLHKDSLGKTPIKMMRNSDYVAYAAKTILNVELLPVQSVVLATMWHTPYPMLLATRGFGKTTMLAFYSMLRMALTPANSTGDPGVKIVITGAGFRQSKQVFEYMENVWYNSPFLRDICSQYGSNQGPFKENDRYTMRIGPNFASAIPLGNGEKVRGLRANIVLADEMNSISPEIFETVVAGFAAVSSDPIAAVKRRATLRKAKELGIDMHLPQTEHNQIIISGTAGYDFEHFCKYHEKYKAFLYSQNKPELLEKYFEDGVADAFDSKDYSIIRIPYDMTPPDFLHEKTIIRAQGTVNSGIFEMEYGCVFSKDSKGFFKRSLIEGCVASEANIASANWVDWCPEPFEATIFGRTDRKYVIAIDPASEVDNCAIVVLELNDNHARVVYVWTINKKTHRAMMAAGLTVENDYNAFVARKIRNLKQAFPCDHIGIDAQGGGTAIVEALHNTNNLLKNPKGEIIESPIWTIVNPDKPQPTDYEPGLHIVELIQFADYKWTYEANHGLKQDMETRSLLFPRFDDMELTMAAERDMERVMKFEQANSEGVKSLEDIYAAKGTSTKNYDAYEDAVMEIEELKNELTSIVVTQTGTGPNNRDRWDTPEIKLNNSKKGRMRKDRYSALVIGNMIARQKRTNYAVMEASSGGLLMSADIKNTKGQAYLHCRADMSDRLQEMFDAL